MSYTPSFQIGDIVSNDELRTEFRVGNMGGMIKFDLGVPVSDRRIYTSQKGR